MSPTNQPGAAINALIDATPELDDLLTVDEVAKILNVPTSWVYEHTRARGVARGDRLPRIKLGKYVRFDPDDVRAFLVRRRSKLG
jgi:excisionase family DNA binding protein